MNDCEQPSALKEPPPRPALPAPDREAPETPPSGPSRRRGPGGRLLGLGVLVLFIAAVGVGMWRHYQKHRQVIDIAVEQANFIPTVRRKCDTAARQTAIDIACDNARLRGGKHFRAHQRLCGEALCRYRRTRQGRAAARRDHRARGRGPGRAMVEQSAAGSGDATPKRSPARIDTGHQQAYFNPRQGRVVAAGAERHRLV